MGSFQFSDLRGYGAPSAVAVNYPFAWRRYPAALVRQTAPPPDPRKVTHEDVIAALERLDTFVDITEDDLLRLHASLTKRVEERARAGRGGRVEGEVGDSN